MTFSLYCGGGGGGGGGGSCEWVPSCQTEHCSSWCRHNNDACSQRLGKDRCSSQQDESAVVVGAECGVDYSDLVNVASTVLRRGRRRVPLRKIAYENAIFLFVLWTSTDCATVLNTFFRDWSGTHDGASRQRSDDVKFFCRRRSESGLFLSSVVFLTVNLSKRMEPKAGFHQWCRTSTERKDECNSNSNSGRTTLCVDLPFMDYKLSERYSCCVVVDDALCHERCTRRCYCRSVDRINNGDDNVPKTTQFF